MSANRGYSPHPSNYQTQQNQLSLVEAGGDSTQSPIPYYGQREICHVLPASRQVCIYVVETPFVAIYLPEGKDIYMHIRPTSLPEASTSTGNAASMVILSSCCHQLRPHYQPYHPVAPHHTDARHFQNPARMGFRVEGEESATRSSASDYSEKTNMLRD